MTDRTLLHAQNQLKKRIKVRDINASQEYIKEVIVKTKDGIEFKNSSLREALKDVLTVNGKDLK